MIDNRAEKGAGQHGREKKGKPFARAGNQQCAEEQAAGGPEGNDIVGGKMEAGAEDASGQIGRKQESSAARERRAPAICF